MKSIDYRSLVTLCMALLLSACMPQTGRHEAGIAYRPHSDAAPEFVQELNTVKLAVYPTIVRTTEDWSYSTRSQQQIVESLNVARVTTAVAASDSIDPGRLQGGSQWEMFVNDKQVIAEALEQIQSDARYSLVMAVLLQPGKRAVFGIHCYILDAQGESVFSFLLNSHHGLFNSANLVVGDGSLESRAVLVEKATRAGVAAFIRQVEVPVVQGAVEHEGYTIATRKLGAFDDKVDSLYVVIQLHERLKSVFMHSFKHSLVSAFEANGVEATVMFTYRDRDGLAEFADRIEARAPDATLLVLMDPLYRERKDGQQAVVGTDFTASLVNRATGEEAWQAGGKVDYIEMFDSNYTAHEGVRKEFAWHTTAAIVRAFMADVNAQESAPIYTVTEDRQFHGQHTD